MASFSISSHATEINSQRLTSCCCPADKVSDPPRSLTMRNINPLNLRAVPIRTRFADRRHDTQAARVGSGCRSFHSSQNIPLLPITAIDRPRIRVSMRRFDMSVSWI